MYHAPGTLQIPLSGYFLGDGLIQGSVGLLVEKAKVLSAANGLSLSFDLEFAKYMLDVGFHGFEGNEHHSCYLLIAVSRRNELQDLYLLSCHSLAAVLLIPRRCAYQPLSIDRAGDHDGFEMQELSQTEVGCLHVAQKGKNHGGIIKDWRKCLPTRQMTAHAP